MAEVSWQQLIGELSEPENPNEDLEHSKIQGERMAYLLSLSENNEVGKKKEKVMRIFTELEGVIYEVRKSQEGTDYFRIEFSEEQTENPNFFPLDSQEASRLGLIVH